jgi:hypothetical protein
MQAVGLLADLKDDSMMMQNFVTEISAIGSGSARGNHPREPNVQSVVRSHNSLVNSAIANMSSALSILVGVFL